MPQSPPPGSTLPTLGTFGWPTGASGRGAGPRRGRPVRARRPSPAIPATGHPRRRAILAVLCLSLLVVVIDNTVLNTALPTLARQLHAGTAALQWITDAYTLTFAALLVAAGALGDRFGRRRALLGGLAIFALGSTTAAFSGTVAALIAGRVVMGIGAAFVMPATLSILNAVFPPAERPRAIAAWSAVAGVGIVIGPTLGGALLTWFWWGSIFLINVPLVALAFLGVVRIVPETVDAVRRRLDVVGTALTALGLFALVDAIIEAPTRGWTAPVTVGEIALGLATLGAFVVHELRVPSPLIDLRVFRSRSFSAAAGSVTVIFFALAGSLFALTQYLQLVHGYSPLSAGLRALPFAGAMGVVSLLSPGLARRLGSRVIVPAGLALMGTGLLGLSFLQPDTAYTVVAGFVVLMGAGMGLVMAPASTTIMASVPAAQAGAGSAVNDTIREVGAALGVAVIGTLVAGVYGRQLGGVLGAAQAPSAVRRLATGSVAAADALGRHVGGATGAALIGAAHQAYVNGMAAGMRVAVGVALVGAVAAFVALPAKRRGGLATLQISAPPVLDWRGQLAPVPLPRPAAAAVGATWPERPRRPARTTCGRRTGPSPTAAS
jgi:EmrB/QacA subfamily drug resistance transporter